MGISVVVGYGPICEIDLILANIVRSSQGARAYELRRQFRIAYIRPHISRYVSPAPAVVAVRVKVNLRLIYVTSCDFLRGAKRTTKERYAMYS